MNEIDVEMAKCHWCLDDMNVGATVCRVCHKHQNILIGWLPQLSLFASIAAVCITGAQWYFAKQEATRAQEAVAEVKEVQREAVSNAIDVNETLIESLSQVANVNHNVYLNAEDKKPYEDIYKQIDSIRGDLEQKNTALERVLK